MTPRILSSAIVILACCSLLPGCGGARQSVADHEVLAAVKRYNQALPAAYARGSTDLLQESATPAEIQRVDDVIGFLMQGRMVMDARLESFEAGPVTQEGAESASVETTEVWWYRHVMPETGEVKQAPRRVRYLNLFRCRKVDGRWLVDRLEERGFEQLPLARTSL